MSSKIDLTKELFTTFDVAGLCHVNITSIKNWIEKGQIRAFRTPGGHWRIERAHLIAFLDRQGMPNPFSKKDEQTTLIFGLGAADCELVRRAVGKSAEVIATDDLIEAAFYAGDLKPVCIVLDPLVKDGLGMNIVALVRADERFTRTQVIVYAKTSDTDFEHRILSAGANQFVRHSDGILALQARVREALV